ncbi:MAG: RidA family protein [Firmicutes bacterium]|nr:RidA family protein [Dethiobacter sp.]MBS3889351.1 RidA family protein [Bacillota bacterium]MBS4055319.1 RidA family protein [Thermaerobacter sp.]
MGIDARLNELGLVIPEAAKPVAAYVPAVRAGSLIFVSGQLPTVKGELKWKGMVGQDLDISAAYEAARICALNCLAAIKTVEPNLDKIKRIVKLTGFVSSLPTFGDQPKVINGASELLQLIFAEKGIHARAAVSVASLPLNAAVEVEMIVEVE